MRGQSEELEKLIGPVVTALGYELIGVEQLRQGRAALVRVYIDSAAGIALADCERVSHQLSGVLDVADPIRGAYTLEVSSPGLDRPLFTREHFRRHAGALAKLRLQRPVDGQRQFRGRLCGVHGAEVILDVGGAQVRLPLELIERARLIPEDGTGPEPGPDDVDVPRQAESGDR